MRFNISELEMREKHRLNEAKELNENSGFWMFGNTIKELVETGVIPGWAAIPIFIASILAVGGFVGATLNIVTGSYKTDLIILRSFMKKVKDRVEFSDTQIEEVIRSAENFIDNIPEKGKRNFMKGLINKYNRQTKAKDFTRIKQEIDSYIENNK